MPTKDQLRSIEWAADALSDASAICPACHAYEDDGTHKPGCWLAAALATPDTLPPVAVGETSEVGWLIERPHREGSAVCTYWSGFSDGAWTRKPELAVRFARQEDAERVRAGILGDPLWSRSAEHMWQRGKD